MCCSKYGEELEDGNIYYSSYDTKNGVAPETPSLTESDKPCSPAAMLSLSVVMGFLLIFNGAVIMLIAMFLDWYTVHAYEHWYLDFAILNKSYSMNYHGLNWFGAALPLILTTVFACITILSAIVSLFTGQLYTRFWGLLGFFSLAVLITNYIYMFMDGMFYERLDGINITVDVCPHIGWLLSSIGAIAIGTGAILIGIGNKNKTFSKIALLPKAVVNISLLPRWIARSFLIMVIGTVMMLLAMVLDLYFVHSHHSPFDLDFDLLNDSDFWINTAIDWPGTALPLILFIIFATTIILSLVYSLAIGQRFNSLWVWLSLLSTAALIGNFVYMRVTYYQEVTPHVGWVVAIIGAIAIGVGAITIGASGRNSSY